MANDNDVKAVLAPDITILIESINIRSEKDIQSVLSRVSSLRLTPDNAKETAAIILLVIPQSQPRNIAHSRKFATIDKILEEGNKNASTQSGDTYDNNYEVATLYY